MRPFFSLFLTCILLISQTTPSSQSCPEIISLSSMSQCDTHSINIFSFASDPNTNGDINSLQLSLDVSFIVKEFCDPFDDVSNLFSINLSDDDLEPIMNLFWDSQNRSYGLQTRNSTNSFVSFNFQSHDNFQNEKEEVIIDFLATIDLKNKFFGAIVRINKESIWELNFPIINESIWKFDSATKFSICSYIQGKSSASCLINKFLFWYLPFPTNNVFSEFIQEHSVTPFVQNISKDSLLDHVIPQWIEISEPSQSITISTLQPLSQSSITVTFWFKTLKFNQATIFRFASSSNLHQDFSLLLNKNGTVTSQLNSDLQQKTSLISLEYSKWTFITATFNLDSNKNSVFLSFNRRCVASQSWASIFSQGFVSFDNLIIGDSNNFTGHIYDFKISASDSYQNVCLEKSERLIHSRLLQSCPSGQYNSGGSCNSCNTVCSTCSDGSSCDSCAAGYGFYGSNSLCVNCPSGTVLSGQNCLSCPSYCLSCSSTSTCTTCYSGYYKSGSTCSPCPTGCSLCTSASVCTSCKIYYALQGSNTLCSFCPTSEYAYQSSCYTTCPSNTYVTTSSGNQACNTCNSRCATCTSNTVCQTCKIPYVIQSGSTMCNSCPAGTYFYSNFSCLPCNTTCATCTSDTECQTCNSGFGLQGNKCDVCPAGTYLSGQTCSNCNTRCATCTASNVCQSCKPGFGFHTSQVCVTCPAGTYLNGQQCTTCPTNCATCTDGQTCQSCNTGYGIVNNLCATCPTGTFLQLPLPNCQNCPNECATCTSLSQCQACNPGYGFDGGSVCVTCPIGKFLQGSICENCVNGCAICENADTCLECQSTRFFYNNLCVANCPTKTFPNFPNCTECLNECATCTHIDNCQSCESGYGYYGNICGDCPISTFLKNQNCTACPNNCLSCSAATTCQSCLPGFGLQNHLCDVCPPKTYLSGQDCLPCPAECSTCSDNHTCQSCQPGYMLNTTICKKIPPFCPGNQSYYFYSEDNKCRATCQYPYNITHVQFKGDLCSLTFSDEELEQIKQLANIASMGGTSGAISGTIMSIIDSANPSALAVSALVKLIQYIKFLNIGYPPKLYLMLKSQKIVAGGITFMPEIPESLLDSFERQELAPQFEKFDLHSSFLVGFWQALMSMLVVLGVIGFVALLELYTKKYKRVNKIIQSANLAIRWNFMMTMLCSSYGDIAFYSALEISTTKLNSFSSVMSFLTCIAMNIIAGFVFWLSIHINLKLKDAAKKAPKGRTTKELEKLKEKWIRFKVFFLEFKNSVFLQQVFTVIFMLRSYVNNLVVVVFKAYPILQSILLTISSVLMTLYLLFKAPMIKSLVNIQQICCEFVLLVINSSILVLSVMDALEIEDIPRRETIGNVVLGINLGMSYAMTGFLVLKVLLIAREFYLEKKALKFKPQIKTKKNTTQNNQTSTRKNHTSINMPLKLKKPDAVQKRKRISKIKKVRAKPLEETFDSSFTQVNIDNSMVSLKTSDQPLQRNRPRKINN